MYIYKYTYIHAPISTPPNPTANKLWIFVFIYLRTYVCKHTRWHKQINLRAHINTPNSQQTLNLWRRHVFFVVINALISLFRQIPRRFKNNSQRRRPHRSTSVVIKWRKRHVWRRRLDKKKKSIKGGSSKDTMQQEAHLCWAKSGVRLFSSSKLFWESAVIQFFQSRLQSTIEVNKTGGTAVLRHCRYCKMTKMPCTKMYMSYK